MSGKRLTTVDESVVAFVEQIQSIILLLRVCCRMSCLGFVNIKRSECFANVLGCNICQLCGCSTLFVVSVLLLYDGSTCNKGLFQVYPNTCDEQWCGSVLFRIKLERII